MIAVIQTMPTRAKVVKDQLAVAPPTASDKLGELHHQRLAPGGLLGMPEMWTKVGKQKALCWGRNVPGARKM
eukprot:12146963-Karenia_brevis.AAC.1